MDRIRRFTVASTAAAAGALASVACSPSPAPNPAGTSRTIALGDPASTLGEVTSIASVTRGRPVVIAGVVERLRDSDEFVLRDTSGAIRVEIGWRNAMPVRPGDRVVVAGVADDDVLPGFRPEVSADRIQLADGRVVELVHGD